ncbi:hypothetical protein ACIRJR_14130 [Streptomyces sp. NPDC102402]|uniref:hypothetical protein n=1 Tax=Streptomyces sp. NPDC102402 TaxID=3366169 RepID=UPI00380F9EAD
MSRAFGTLSEALQDDSWSGQDTVPVISPDALSPDGMAEVLSEVLQRPARFQQVDAHTHKATMMQYGMSETFAQSLDMAAAQSDGIYEAEQALASPAPTSFRQWREEVRKPATHA